MTILHNHIMKSSKRILVGGKLINVRSKMFKGRILPIRIVPKTTDGGKVVFPAVTRRGDIKLPKEKPKEDNTIANIKEGGKASKTNILDELDKAFSNFKINKKPKRGGMIREL